MSTLNTHPLGTPEDGPAIAQEYIQRPWAAKMRHEYRLLRVHGLPASTARTVVHQMYYVGLNAGREEAHQERLAQIRGRAA